METEVLTIWKADAEIDLKALHSLYEENRQELVRTRKRVKELEMVKLAGEKQLQDATVEASALGEKLLLQRADYDDREAELSVLEDKLK